MLPRARPLADASIFKPCMRAKRAVLTRSIAGRGPKKEPLARALDTIYNLSVRRGVMLQTALKALGKS